MNRRSVLALFSGLFAPRVATDKISTKLPDSGESISELGPLNRRYEIEDMWHVHERECILPGYWKMTKPSVSYIRMCRVDSEITRVRMQTTTRLKGRFNVRSRDGLIEPAQEKSPHELLAMCLEGSSLRVDCSILHNVKDIAGSRPHVTWSLKNPIDAAEELLEQFGMYFAENDGGYVTVRAYDYIVIQGEHLTWTKSKMVYGTFFMR